MNKFVKKQLQEMKASDFSKAIDKSGLRGHQFKQKAEVKEE